MRFVSTVKARPGSRRLNDRRRIALFDHLEQRTLLCDPGWVKWTFGADQSNNYVLSSYSAFDANVGPLNAVDPNLQLVIGARYTVTVVDPYDHPLQIIAKGATAENDVLLLSQQHGAVPGFPAFTESGSFQSDPGVDFVNDEADKTVSFTLTQALADAMSDPSKGLVPGYRCGNPFHRDFQRGDLILTGGAPAPRDPSDPVGNSIATATPISLDASGSASRSGTLGTTGSADVYSFAAPVSGTITVAQNASPGSSLESLLFAYDSSGGFIGENGNGGDGLLSFKVNAGSTYYVQAAGFAGSTGGYNLSFTTNPLGTPAGGGTLDAQQIFLNGLGSAQESGAVELPGAKHDYQFTATISGHMTITERAGGSGLDSLMTVYNSSGVVIAADDDGGGGLDSLATFDVVAGRSYTVRAAGLGLSDGAYQLAISTADVGDSIPTAGTINLSDSGSGSTQGHIGMGGQTDLYKVQATASGTMTTLLESTFNGTVTVEDANGNVIDDFDNIGNDGEVSYSVSQGDTYYVRVSAYGDETGTFTMYLSVDNSPSTFDQAAPIPLSGQGFGTQLGEIGLPNTTDVYSFVAPTSGTMVVSMDAVDGTSIDSNLTAYDASRQALSSNDNLGASLNSRVEFPVVAGQTYYLRAGASDGSIGQYNLTLTLAKSPAELSSPTTITLDASGSGRASGVVSIPGEVETYQFVATASGQVSISLDASSASHLDGRLKVFDNRGALIASDDDSGGGYNSLLTIDEVAGQTYEVQVSGFETSVGGFDLIVGDDYGNDPAHAFPISLDASGLGSISGQINPAGDVDVFKLIAPASGQLTVALTQPSTGPIASPFSNRSASR